MGPFRTHLAWETVPSLRTCLLGMDLPSGQQLLEGPPAALRWGARVFMSSPQLHTLFFISLKVDDLEY